MTTQTINIDGMHCQGCVASVTKALQSLSGVNDVSVSLDKSQAVVDFEAQQVSPAALVAAIEDAGFDARTDEEV